MKKPHRLSWFKDQIGKKIKRRDFITNLFIEIEVTDSWKAQQLFATQFDVNFRYDKIIK